jgi:class 3 adenylate cyclase/tetratricopeptide (TPR) repeat protein
MPTNPQSPVGSCSPDRPGVVPDNRSDPSPIHEDGSWQPRAMVMFCDLVGSTELSGRHEPERYGLLVRRYLAEVRTTIEDRFGGHVVSVEGDGLLALFGAPHARGDDAERAIRAALGVVERVRTLSAQTQHDVGEALAVRIAVHRGQVYWAADDSVYGLAVNIAARLQTLAATGDVVVSDDVQRMIGHLFESEAGEPQLVKGVNQPIRAHRIVGERADREVRQGVRAPLIDRKVEWERLRNIWNGVRQGEAEAPVALLLRGEAGVGKSCLASRMAWLAGDDGAVVVELVGSAFFEGAGLYPIRRLLERTVGVERDTGGSERLQRLRGDLAGRGLEADTLLPLLAPILGLEPAAGYLAEPMDARMLNEEILEAAHAYVESCLGQDPSVLVVEDVHWLDSSTLDLVARLTKRRGPCVVAMTARQDFVPFDGVEVIELETFSEQDSGRLVDALCADSLVSAAIRRDVVARSDGIPLYIEELVANARHGVLDATPAQRDEISDRSSGVVPDLLYDLLAARLDASTGIIPVATASAAIGRDVDGQLLEQVLDLPPSELDTALQMLCAQGVLESRGAVQGQYRFRHELLREVAYELQPPSRRRYVHSKLGDALSSPVVGDVVDWGVVASHYERAGREAEASVAHEQAATAARMRGAFREARGHLNQAIELLTSGVDHDLERDVQEVRLRLQRGYLAISEEGPVSPAGGADYERCLELTAADPFGDEMFNTVIVLWTYHLIRGELSRCRDISDFTYRSIQKREWYLIFNIAALGIIDCWEGDFRAARDLLETFDANRVQADEEHFLAEWFNPNEPVTVILTCVGLVRFVMGDAVGADLAFVAAFERAQTMSFPEGPYSAAYALSVEAWMRLEREQFDEAEDRLNRLADVAAQHGFDGWTLVAATQQTVLAGLRALHVGADAQTLAGHASALSGMTEVWKRIDTRIFLPYYLMLAGVLYAGAGELHTARSRLEESLGLARETGMQFWGVETLRHLSHIELHQAGREAKLREALQMARNQHAHLFELRTALDLADLDRRHLHEVEAALGRLGRGALYPEVALAEAALATVE